MSEAASMPWVPEHELLRIIGRGSHGEVWLARSVTGQYRAVKIVQRAAFANEAPFEREFEGVQRFEPVSRRHEGFIDVLQVGFGEGRTFFYCVMELADAVEPPDDGDFDPEMYAPRTLENEMASRGKLPLDECRALGVGLAEALAYLHDAGLVHRDVKPSNIVYVRGEPRLADIGLVSVADDGALVGTWGYAPHEGLGTPAADLFSLGKVLYELATGRDRTEFPELDDPSPDWREMNRILLRACHEYEAERYTCAKDLAQDLAANKPAPLPRSWRWLPKSAVALLVGAGLAMIWPSGGPDLQANLDGHWPAEVNATDMPEGARSFQTGPMDREQTTVSFWFRTHDVTTSREVLGARDGGTNQWGWAIFRGQLDLHWRSEFGGHRVKIGPISPGHWHHVAVVFQPGEGIRWRAYLNGRVAADYEKPQPPVGMGTRLAVGGPGGFQGQLQHLRVYGRSLPEEEIAAIHRLEKPPSSPAVQWDWEYHYTDALDPVATNHIHELRNVRAYREWQSPPNTYWGPVVTGKPAWMIYRFEFERPAAAAFLRAGLKCFDLSEEQSSGGAARGAGALSVSADGKNWFPLRDALHPRPRWAAGFVHADLLPKAVLGQKELWVKVEFQTEGAQSDTYTTAQHSWDRGRKHPPFELKVQFKKTANK